MNKAQKETLKNVQRAVKSAERQAERAYRLTKDEGTRKLAEAVVALSETVGFLTRLAREEVE